MSKPVTMATLYAVLVGINKYKAKEIRDLQGCEYDLDKMRVFLKNYTLANQLELQLVQLKNWEATRQNVIDSFQHFRPALSEDICIFYYSGHGSQVDAPPELAHLQSDGKLETIVCNDSRSSPKIGDLTDKEIGHLIWESTSNESGSYKGNHFLAIFDSCHSGSITRNTTLVPKLQNGSGTLQGIEEFYGYKDYDKTTEGLQPKSGPHVVLSASQANQSAYEKPFQGIHRGVFTTALLEAFENENLSARTYSQLVNLINSNLHPEVLNLQNPFHESRGLSDGEHLSIFGREEHKVFQHYLFYDHNRQQWKVNLGSIHGVNPQDQLHVYFEGDQSGKVVRVTRTMPNESIVQPGTADLSTDQIHWVNFEPEREKITLFILPGSEKVNGFVGLREKLQDEEGLILTTAEEADYFIDFREDQLVLLPKGSDRPCFEGQVIEKHKPNHSIEEFIRKLKHVARWLFIWKWKKRNGTRLQVDKEFEIEFNLHPNYVSGDQTIVPEPINFRDAPPVIEYQFKHNQWEKPWVSLSVKRKEHASYRKDLWVSVLFLDERYSSTNEYFPLERVASGQKYPLHVHYLDNGFKQTVFPLFVPDILLDQWGENEVCNLFKVIISTAPLNLDDFQLQPLELPRHQPETLRGIKATKNTKGDYDVFDIPFVVRRPLTVGQIVSGQEVVLNEKLKISAPAGFSAEQVQIASPSEATRSTGGAPFPPRAIQGLLEPCNLIPGRKSDEAFNVIDLHGCNGMEVVSRDHPITIQLGQGRTRGESILPLGYDSETQCYIPLGYMDSEGTVKIEHLPEVLPSTTKGLGKSIKIYLQRLVHTQILNEEDPYPILAIAAPDENEEMQYIKDKGVIKSRVEQADSMLVIIHGLIGDTSDKRHITTRIKRFDNGQEKDLRSKYDLTLTFDYDSLNVPIEETAQGLLDLLAELGVDKRKGKQVHIVAHSMGGLVARWMLEKLGGDQLVSHFVQVGSPNLGSPWASAYDYFNTALGLVINFANSSVPLLNEVLSFLGKAWDNMEVTTMQLQPGSEFIKQLNESADPPPIPYTILSGDCSLMPVQQERRRKFLSKVSSGVKGSVINALFDEANDAIVSVSSMTAFPPGSVTIIEPIACDHFGYFKTEESVKRLGEVLWKL
jgi:pimeloyl-ACP methyl ester carboxylesterase